MLSSLFCAQTERYDVGIPYILIVVGRVRQSCELSETMYYFQALQAWGRTRTPMDSANHQTLVTSKSGLPRCCKSAFRAQMDSMSHSLPGRSRHMAFCYPYSPAKGNRTFTAV
jgi:hypothetical protein